MVVAESTTWLASAGLDAGGIVAAVLVVGVVTVIAMLTRRPGSGTRTPGSPIYRRNSGYGRRRREPNDGPDSGDGSDWGDSGYSGDSGGGCGGGGGGGD